MRNVFDHKSGESLDIDGAKIYYEICGDPEGRPLLMLHGGFGTIEDFNVFLTGLSSDFRMTYEKLVTIGGAWRLLEDDPVREIFSRATAKSWQAKLPETYDLHQRLNPQPDFDAFAIFQVRESAP